MRVVLERSSSPERRSSDSMKSNCLARAEAARPLGDLLLLDGDDVDWDAVEAHALQQVLGLLVHIEHAALGVLGEVERRYRGQGHAGYASSSGWCSRQSCSLTACWR